MRPTPPTLTAVPIVVLAALATTLATTLATVLATTPTGWSATLPPGPPICAGEVATLVGSPGRDVLVGTPGRDVIVALSGTDVVRAGDGDDLICGGDGADRLFGGAGDDVLLAGRARWYDDRAGSGYVPDRLYGGPGDDVLDIGPEPVDRGYGISGEIRFPTAAAGVVVDLAAGTAVGEGADTVVARPGLRVTGTASADVLLGSEAPEELVGRGGPDRIEGRGGDDRLFGEQEASGGRSGSAEGASGADDDDVIGGRGEDLVAGDLGADDLRGGPGLDLVLARGAGAQRVSGGPGDDFLDVAVSASPGLRLVGGAGRDDLTAQLHPGVALPSALEVDLRDGTVALGGAVIGTIDPVERFRTYAPVPLTFHGTDGADEVYAAPDGRLRAWTDGGDDVVWGSRKGDTIDAGAGTDEVRGDLGRDTCLGAERVRGCETTS